MALREKTTAYFSKLNPSTGLPLANYPIAGQAEIIHVIRQARRHQREWQNAPLKDRASVLKAVEVLLKKEAERLAKLVSQEVGKPVSEVYETELLSAVGILGYYATTGPKILKERLLPLDKSILMGRLHWRRLVPRGVVGIISPWNFPLAIPTSGIAAALMAGNAAILKPSEHSPATGLALCAIFQQALRQKGFSPELVQCVIGDGQSGQWLCQPAQDITDSVDYAIFTGSGKTGRRIREMMSESGREASLELGGSDPTIILPDSDYDAATSYALWGRLTNAGQMCAATKRLIVPKHDYEEILSLLKNKVAQLKVGPPENPENQIGPLISEAQRQLVLAQVEEALSKGARLITGGKALPGKGYFMQPTVLADVFLNARVVNEEVFGPVLPVLAYDSVEEAIALANQSSFGLTASVFGPVAKARSVAEKLQAGCVTINDVGATSFSVAQIPWRGWKASGPGGSHGEQSLLELCLQQTQSVNLLYAFPTFRKQPWHYSKGEYQKNRLSLGNTLLHHYAGESWLEKLSPKLLLALLAHRSSRKL
ncbi:MAG: aldehyde dehydrogenase family protein [Vampirovibrionales bacterium]|nr:aldehyde dehydrogenase family protein [Vampirovibrionales bacterium]